VSKREGDSTPDRLPIRLGMLGHCHLPWLAAIERKSFERPWSQEALLQESGQRQDGPEGPRYVRDVMVAVRGGQVVGYVFYELHKHELRLVRMAVDPACRREGIGTAMVEKLLDKLSERRSKLVVHVRETNLPAQLLFKSNGLRAVHVWRQHFADTNEDAYTMVRRHSPRAHARGR
jgi:ribosomal-protein-alanine N-acetyltransferase